MLQRESVSQFRKSDTKSLVRLGNWAHSRPAKLRLANESAPDSPSPVSTPLVVADQDMG